jgi:hypothetical protein
METTPESSVKINENPTILKIFFVWSDQKQVFLSSNKRFSPQDPLYTEKIDAEIDFRELQFFPYSRDSISNGEWKSDEKSESVSFTLRYYIYDEKTQQYTDRTMTFYTWKRFVDDFISGKDTIRIKFLTAFGITPRGISPHQRTLMTLDKFKTIKAGDLKKRFGSETMLEIIPIFPPHIWIGKHPTQTRIFTLEQIKKEIDNKDTISFDFIYNVSPSSGFTRYEYLYGTMIIVKRKDILNAIYTNATITGFVVKIG